MILIWVGGVPGGFRADATGSGVAGVVGWPGPGGQVGVGGGPGQEAFQVGAGGRRAAARAAGVQVGGQVGDRVQAGQGDGRPDPGDRPRTPARSTSRRHHAIPEHVCRSGPSHDSRTSNVRGVPAANQNHEFDVALSYASEDRVYVQQVAKGLRDAGIRVFYDEFAVAELWGVDLYSYLDDVYRRRARFTVVFVSRSYAAKKWTAHERQSAQARALDELGPYLLPVRLDNAELPGFRSTIAYQDARYTSPARLIEILEEKLDIRTVDAQVREIELVRATGFPKTARERQKLINERPLDSAGSIFCGHR